MIEEDGARLFRFVIFQVSLARGKNYDDYFNKPSQRSRQLSQVHLNSRLRTNN
jgi:hypothetical protein